MKLTFAIPYHSNPGLLDLAVRSLLAQDDDNWFAVVCDDSDDKSGEPVVKDVADSRIVYARNPNPGGMVTNWNFAISQARTDWVTLLHADDELGPRYVRCMRRLAANNPNVAMFYCQAEVIDLRGRRVFSFPDWVKGWFQPVHQDDIVLAGEAAVVALLTGNFIFCPSVCYRSEIIKETLFSSRFNMVQDLELYLRLLENGLTIIGSKDRQYRYRRHENATAVMTRELTRFHEEIGLYADCARRYEQLGWKHAHRTAKEMRIIRLHLLYRILFDVLGLRWSGVRAKAKLLVQIFETMRLLS